MKLWIRSSKGFLLIMASLSLFLLAGCSGGGGGATTQAPTVAPKHTVMVYMVGSNLESEGEAATADLKEMMQVGSTENLNVVVTTGGAKKTGWTTVQWHKVNKGSLTTLPDLGSLNMGDSNTLRDFITWAVANYPADHYTLIMWDHGGGAIGGFGSDDNFNGDALNLSEIAKALSEAKAQTGVTFDLIGFDACLMATVEVANTLSPYANYMVASEETEPGTGWDYAAILNAISSNTSTSGSSLGKSIVDSYSASLAGSNDQKTITLSVIDLSKVGAVVSSLENLTNAINGDFAIEDINNRNSWLSISSARSKSEDYGNDKANGSFTDMVDLKDLASLISSQGKYPSEANTLISAINDAVTDKFAGQARPNSNGLSVYFPYHKNYDTGYDNIDFSSAYKDMLKGYVNLRNSDTTIPVFAPLNLSGNIVTTQMQSNDVGNEDIYAVLTKSDPQTGSVTILGMTPPDSIDSAGNVTFTWDGKSLALMSGSAWVYAPVFVIDAGASGYFLDIPAYLKSVLVDIFIYLDKNTSEYTVIGAWPGMDANGMAERDIIEIKSGDEVVPCFLKYDISSNSYAYALGDSLTIGSSGLNLGMANLQDGTYYVSFYATDYSSNAEMSEFAQFTVSTGLGKRIAPTDIGPNLSADIMRNILSPSGIARSVIRGN